MIRSTARVALALLLVAPAMAAGPIPGAVAVIKDATGKEVGDVILLDMHDHLMGTVEISGLAPGQHGIHIHMTGKCDAPGFTTAGGHLNPDNKQHGLKNPMGAHQGDLPQLVAGPDGEAKLNFNVRSSLAEVLDADGSAFVVHSGPDDMMSDPAGNSGARILCGVFTPYKS